MRWAFLVLIGACGGGEPATDPPCQPSILYLNRGGGDFTHGTVDVAAENRSTIVDTPITLPAYPRDDIEWRQITDCIHGALAPFPIAITEVDPGTAAHVELVFTTAYWAGSAGITHVIPDSCRPGNAIAFIFGNALPSDARACQIAMIAYAQMTALLSYGRNCHDFVDRSMDCAPTRDFVDEDVPCVDANDQPIACRCGGATQNTYAALAAAHPSCP